MDLQLARRIAIVTGGGVGIGFGIAQMLTEEGAKVVLVGRRAEMLESAAEKLAALGGEVPVVLAQDLALPDAGRDLARRALERLGRIDILINNAGVSQPLSTTGSDEAWAAALSLRFTEVRHLIEALLPGMKQNGFGRIINIGGGWEVQDVINSASVVNAARTVYCKSLSREVGRYGITVNTVGPGRIASEQIERMHPAGAERDAFIAKNIPAGYFGDPQDLACLVGLLASPRGRYINGEVIAVDGGMHRYAF